jgi:transcriptional regulator with XRE-family HTH domain
MVDTNDDAIETHTESLALTLRRLRIERNVSQAEVARATGISSSFLSLVEQGRSDIAIGRLLRLARFYGVELTDLIGGGNEAKDEPIRVLRTDPNHMIHSDTEDVDVFDLATGARWTLVPLLSVHQAGSQGQINDIGEHEAMLFVLEGTYEIALAGHEPVRLQAGEGVLYLSVAPYRITNVGDRPGRMLGIGLRQPPQPKAES